VWEDEAQDIAEYAVMLAVILLIVVGTIQLIDRARTMYSLPSPVRFSSQAGGFLPPAFAIRLQDRPLAAHPILQSRLGAPLTLHGLAVPFSEAVRSSRFLRVAMNRSRLLLIGIVALALGAFRQLHRLPQSAVEDRVRHCARVDVVIAAGDIQVGAKIEDKDVKVVRFPPVIFPQLLSSEIFGRWPRGGAADCQRRVCSPPQIGG